MINNGLMDKWKSKDFYKSCVIRATGASLLCIETANHEYSTFVFDIPAKDGDEIISLHWDRKLTLPTRDLIEAINELKVRLRYGSD
jgi:hypothetical protein